MSRIAAIDSLRALAVLSVVVYHLDARWLPGGFAGVDIFFVISGYVVTRSLAAHGGERLGTFIAGFYARRMRRILPAFLVCLVATVALDVLFVPQAWLSSVNFDTARYALVGLSNIFLASNQEGYFTPRIEFNPYAHTWSLGVEEQFYVFLPFLFFAVRRACRVPSARSTWWIPAVCIVSLACSAWLSISGSPSAYYALVSRFWELGVGAALAERHRPPGGSPLFASVSTTTILGLSLALLAIGLRVSGTYYFPFPTALLVVTGSVLLIDRVASGAAVPPAWLAVPAVVWIGTISYSIYLWHWPVFSLFRWTVGLEGFEKRAAAVVTVALLSIASYYCFERPFQRIHVRRAPRVAVIGGGLVAIGLAYGFAGVLHDEQPQLSLSTTRDRATWYAVNRSSNGTAVGCRSTQRNDRFGEGRVIRIDRHDCDDGPRSPTLFVAGDSHAEAYLAMLGRFVTERPYRLQAYVMPGCPFFTLRSSSRDGSAGCAVFVRSALAEIERTGRPGDLLFLPSLRMQRSGDQWGRVLAADAKTGVALQRQLDEAIDEADALLRPFDALGITIVFEAPKPIFDAPPFRCVDWFDRANPVCAAGFVRDTATLERARLPVLLGMRRLQADLGHVQIWDPFPVLCPGTSCNAFDGPVPMFFDGDHLSAAGNDKLYPGFAAFIEQANRP